MKFEFESKQQLGFAQVLELRNKVFQQFGESNFIVGELQFAAAPISGYLNLNLAGLALDSLSVECFLSKGEKSLKQLKEIYQKLEPVVGKKHVLSVDYEFQGAFEPAKKNDCLTVMTVAGRASSFGFLSYHPTHRKDIMQQVINQARLDAQISESTGNWFIHPGPGSGVEVSLHGSNGENPLSIHWPATGDAVEKINLAEQLAVAMADPAKGIKCSWKADTVMDAGTAEELVTLLNAEQLTLPKGKLEFSYCLKELEGLESVRALLGPKAKLSAQASVFRYPEGDRGQLWVETTPNGYKVQIHLDDPDRLIELQRHLGVEFQERADYD